MSNLSQAETRETEFRRVRSQTEFGNEAFGSEASGAGNGGHTLPFARLQVSSTNFLTRQPGQDSLNDYQKLLVPRAFVPSSWSFHAWPGQGFGPFGPYALRGFVGSSPADASDLSRSGRDSSSWRDASSQPPSRPCRPLRTESRTAACADIITANGNILTTNKFNLVAGTYKLANLGDLQLTAAKTFIFDGKGPGVTIINAEQFERVFEITTTATVLFENLTITGGQATDSGSIGGAGALGGGILDNGGAVTLDNAVVQSCVANGPNGANGGNFGGIMPAQPGQPGAIAEGGGIFTTGGSLTLKNNSSLLGNLANGGKGGLGGKVRSPALAPAARAATPWGAGSMLPRQRSPSCWEQSAPMWPRPVMAAPVPTSARGAPMGAPLRAGDCLS